MNKSNLSEAAGKKDAVRIATATIALKVSQRDAFIDEQLDVSARTIRREWRIARAWLYRALAND